MSGTARRAVLALATLSVVGVVVELVFNRHWTERSQLIAWVAIALVVSAIVAAWRGPNDATTRVIRLAMALVVAASLVGVVLHVHANEKAAPLDAVYGSRWPTMSVTARWWAAISQQVGPAPAVVPLILAQVAALVLLATMSARVAD